MTMYPQFGDFVKVTHPVRLPDGSICNIAVNALYIGNDKAFCVLYANETKEQFPDLSRISRV